MPSDPRLLAYGLRTCPGQQRHGGPAGRGFFIKGANPWRYSAKGAQADAYQQEHDDLFDAIRKALLCQDRDLLVLEKPFGVAIVTPVELLRQLRL